MKLKNYISIGAIIILIGTTLLNQLYAQNYSWKQKADYGGGEVHDPFAFVIGSKAYVGTGISLQPTTIRNDFWEYDPVTNTWTQKANFPGTARYGARGFAIGNFGYAGTGWDPGPKTDFFRYDPVNNLWSAIPSFGGTGRYTSTAFSIDNFGYLGLGYSPCKKDFWKFDPALNSWSQIALFPGAARQTASAFVISNFAYVGLGLCPGNLFNDFYQYNPFTNTWSPISNFPGGARCASYSFTINNKGIIAMGCDYLGTSQPFNILNDVWQYDPSNGNWQQLPNFPGTKLYNGIYFSINNKGYLGMGTDTITASTHYSSEFWEYSLDSVTSVQNLSYDNFGLQCWPNPSNDFLDISYHLSDGALVSCEVYSLDGKRVLLNQFESVNGVNRHRIETGMLANGTYLLRLSTGHTVQTVKFTVLN